MSTERPRAAIYSRLSQYRSDDDEPSTSITRQVATLEAIAERQDYEVVATLVDENVSGSTGAQLTRAYGQLLDLVERREVEVVLADDLDRLGRNTVQVGLFLQECRSRSKKRPRVLVVTPGGEIDPDDPSDEMVAG